VSSADQWIDGLGPRLEGQAALLRRLLSSVESDNRWSWLELGCSVADGRGDELSDLDLGLGYAGGEPPTAHDVTALLSGLGDVVDIAVQPWEGAHRYWAQYRDGGQIDLVVVPAEFRDGRAPHSVALLDRTGRLQRTFVPRQLRPAPDEPRQWLQDGWEALGNIAKYLRRASVLEAVEQLHRARTRMFQLWAAGERVDYPVFGLTSLLDHSRARLPLAIEETYVVAQAEDVLAAALRLAEMLPAAARHADSNLDTPLREFVTTRLQGLVGSLDDDHGQNPRNPGLRP
jgi:hypothetical protein